MDHASLSRRIAAAATVSDDGDGLLALCGPMLAEAGLPLWRLGVSMPALDTAASSFSMAWRSDGGVTVFRAGHGPADEQAFLHSPIRTLLDRDLRFGRWKLDDLQPDDGYPVLQECKDEGGTDYLLHLVTFAPGTALRGVGLCFATRSPTGFTDDHLADIEGLVPVLGLAMAKVAMSFTLRRTLGTYLGPATADHVLGGRILRGEGRTIWAAILLVDLRGFTGLTDRSEPTHVVSWLDEHLEALGDPVVESGGEILKFLGDGFLAVFPIDTPQARPCSGCDRALAAASTAQAANRLLNQRRQAAGLPTLEADLVLHFGEVVYGNVGTRQRLDFTVIGRAVNEASRIEKNCEELDCAILISETFAARCRLPLRQVGSVPLRGLTQPQRIWTLPGGTSMPDVVSDGKKD